MPKNKQTKAASDRTRVKNIRSATRELAPGEMKKVKGGLIKEGFGTLGKKRIAVDPSDPSGNI